VGDCVKEGELHGDKITSGENWDFVWRAQRKKLGQGYYDDLHLRGHYKAGTHV